MTATETTVPETAQVAIVAGDAQLDYSLPLNAPIAMMMSALREDLKADLSRLGKGAVIMSLGLEEANRNWRLTRISGTALPLEKSLAECGVGNGDVLTIKGFPSPEGYTPIVEDVVDAVADLSRLAYPDFTAETSRAMGLAALPLAGLIIAVASVVNWYSSDYDYVGAAISAVFALITWVGALIARHRWASTQMCYALSMASFPLIAAAAYTAVPAVEGISNAPNWLAASAAVSMASVLLLRLTGVGLALNTGVVTAGLIGTGAFAVATFTDIPGRQTAATLVLITGILLINAPLLAVRLAHIPLPSLPAPGEQIRDDDIARSFMVDEERLELVDTSLAALEYRARASTKYLTGVLAGTLTVLVPAAGVLVEPMSEPYAVQGLAIGLLVVATLAFRGRSYRDRTDSLLTFFAAAITAAVITWQLLATGPSLLAQAVTLSVLGAAAIATSVLAIRAPKAQWTPTTRRGLELIEQALIIAIPILVMWVNGIYALARNR